MTNSKFRVSYTPKLSLTNLDDILPVSITPFMQAFLGYELAKRLSNQYKIPWSPDSEKTRLQSLTLMMQNKSSNIQTPQLDSFHGNRSTFPWWFYLNNGQP